MDGGPTRGPRGRSGSVEPGASSPAREHISRGSAEGTMDELIRSHAPKRERDFDAAPPAKQRLRRTTSRSTARSTSSSPRPGRRRPTAAAEGGGRAPLAQRAKQVEFGKGTNGYENYVRAVPKRERKGYQEHPRTRDITQGRASKFDGIVQAWRKLHEWDEPAPTAPAPAAAADGDAAAATAADKTTPLTTTSSRHSDNSGRPGPCPRPRVPPRRAGRSPRAVARRRRAAAAGGVAVAPPREPTMRERLDAMKRQPPPAAARRPPPPRPWTTFTAISIDV